MSLRDLLDLRLIDPQGDALGAYRSPYLVFNGVEAAIWLGCGIFVAVRAVRAGITGRELAYAGSFALFALSDAIEMQGTTPLLLLFKLACLLAIVGFRREALARHGGRLL